MHPSCGRCSGVVYRDEHGVWRHTNQRESCPDGGRIEPPQP